VSGAKVILIMGHTNCGAIKSAVDNVQLGNITAMLSNIKPAVESVTGVPGERTSKNKNFVEAVAKQNVLIAAKTITDKSAIVKGMVESGQVVIAGCMYDLESGVVTFYDK
jgi:carbonic anhydrase